MAFLNIIHMLYNAKQNTEITAALAAAKASSDIHSGSELEVKRYNLMLEQGRPDIDQSSQKIWWIVLCVMFVS